MNPFLIFRSIKFFLPITCIILLCTGCFRFNVTITVEDDGTGTLGGEYAISKQLSEVFGDESEELSCEEILEADEEGLGADPLSDFPSGAVIENFEDDKWCGYTFTASFTDFGRSFIEAGDDDFPITEEDGLLFFNLPTGDLGLGDSDDFDMRDEDVDPITLLQAFGIPQPEFTINVDLPGEILEHNADTRDGSTLTWAIDFLNPKPDFSPYAKSDLTATAEVKGKNIFVIVAGIVGAISLILAAKFVYAKNNETV
tara:strand:+ start:79 stop:846 length:768 start_codon:yes stop_codon:yes gene_type:complete